MAGAGGVTPFKATLPSGVVLEGAKEDVLWLLQHHNRPQMIVPVDMDSAAFNCKPGAFIAVDDLRDAPRAPTPAPAISVGDRVRVVDGLLEGCEGVIDMLTPDGSALVDLASSRKRWFHPRSLQRLPKRPDSGGWVNKRPPFAVTLNCSDCKRYFAGEGIWESPTILCPACHKEAQDDR